MAQLINMAMAAAVSTLLLLLLDLAASAPAVAEPYEPPTVQELMDKYGLPRGLLPKTAHRYLLHSDGTFQLFLDDGCVVEAGGYRIGYDIKISGTVSPKAVTGLKGIRVRVLFAWVPITGVEVGSGDVTVHIGPISKSFPVVGFKSSPRCIVGLAPAVPAGAVDAS